jgi:hypothetical protein
MWKKLVTARLAAIPWRLGNSIGDFSWLVAYQPSALRYTLKSWLYTFDIVRSRIPKELEPYKYELITSGVFGGGDPDILISWQIAMTQGSVWRGLLNWFDLFSQRLEITPKLASFLDNIERVERGESPILTGAAKWIKDIAKDEVWKIAAIAERASEITVDYTAMPPQFRSMFSQLLAPFLYWYVRSLDKIIHNFFTKDGFIRTAGLTMLPMILGYYWNTSDPRRKAVWEALPPWAKFFSIVAGFDDTDPDRPKPIVVNFYGPGQMAADFLGFDVAFDLALKVKQGIYSPEEAVGYWLFNAPVKFGRKFAGLVNPIAQGIIMMATNHDPFLNRQIVPDQYVGTPEGNKALFSYAAQRMLLSPILPAMMAGGVSDAMEFIRRIYGDKDTTLVMDFMSEFADRLVNPFRAFTINPDAVRFYMSQHAYVEQQEMRKQAEAYLLRMYNALKNKDTQQFKELYEKVASGDLNFINIQDVVNYFNRPSVKANWIRDTILPEVKDPLRRQILRELINQLRSLEAIKHAKKSQKEYLYQQFFGTSNYLWNSNPEETE